MLLGHQFRVGICGLLLAEYACMRCTRSFTVYIIRLRLLQRRVVQNRPRRREHPHPRAEAGAGARPVLLQFEHHHAVAVGGAQAAGDVAALDRVLDLRG